MTTFTWAGGGGNNFWSTAGNWTPGGGPPGSTADADLPANGESVVVGNGVNGAADVLVMGSQSTDANAPTLTVDNGRTFTVDGATSTIASGTIDVQTGATMVWDFGGTFYDQGTIVVGEIFNSSGGNGSLGIDGDVVLDAGNVNQNTQNILYLGQTSVQFQNESTGSITNSGGGSDALTNAGTVISGAGTISVSTFDNLLGGTVEASQTRGSALQISSTTFSNEGLMVAETTAALDFGADGQSGSLTNTGTIRIEENADLAISGNFTISGTGTIENPGADGADISSDQNGPATFTNESNIDYYDSGQIGDQGLNGGNAANDLTFVNDDGTVSAYGFDGILTLNTGNKTITNDGGGLLLAENGGQLLIDSAVITGGTEFVFDGHEVGGGGTIEAYDGGTVTIDSAISPGSGAPPYGDGQILIDYGTVILAPGATDTTPINFSGFDGSLQLDSAANSLATIGGMEAGDDIDLHYLSFAAGDQAVFNAGTLSLENSSGATLASFTLSGSYASADFTVQSDYSGDTEIVAVNPPPPSSTTADMILEQTSSGTYEIYDLGNNAILAAYPLGQIAPQLQVAGLGGFDGTDTSDMLMRDMTNGQLQIDDVSNNNFGLGIAIGQVGLEWKVSGFADFSGNPGETDMLMQNGNNGDFEVYDLSNNRITNAAPMGQVGAPWVVAGFGDFSGNAGETGDMLMRNGSTGAFEVYDISDNTITFAAGMGQVGLEWTVAGFGDFSGNANETDMLMRNTNNGDFEVYDISDNTITFAAGMGQVGLEWTVAGFGDLSGNANETDMLMRNSNTGAFEYYDITGNQIIGAGSMGQVGLEWSVAGIAADPPGGAPANSTAQLTQSMASYAQTAGVSGSGSPPAQSTMPEPNVSALVPHG